MCKMQTTFKSNPTESMLKIDSQFRVFTLMMCCKTKTKTTEIAARTLGILVLSAACQVELATRDGMYPVRV